MRSQTAPCAGLLIVPARLGYPVAVQRLHPLRLAKGPGLLRKPRAKGGQSIRPSIEIDNECAIKVDHDDFSPQFIQWMTTVPVRTMVPSAAPVAAVADTFR